MKGIAPLKALAPSITGGLLEGEELKLSPGEWTGTQPISFSYAWELCDAAGESCKEIEGAAGPTLQLLAGFIGDTVEGVVSAKNVAGETTATSSLTSVVKGIAPVLAAAPAISGGLIEGDELKASSGNGRGRNRSPSATYGSSVTRRANRAAKSKVPRARRWRSWAPTSATPSRWW